MARPTKQGLDYFPFDVGFFEDDKIEFVSAKFGTPGEIITIKLLCKIYSTEGYYYSWGEDEAILFSKKIGYDFELVSGVVLELLKRDFFDREIYKCHTILTSHGIQIRFFEACHRRKIVKCNINYLSEGIRVTFNGVNVNINGKNVTLSTQSKVKESKEKVKESKGEEKRISDFEKPIQVLEEGDIFITPEKKEEKSSGQKEETQSVLIIETDEQQNLPPQEMGMLGKLKAIHKEVFPAYVWGEYDSENMKGLIAKMKTYLQDRKKEQGLSTWVVHNNELEELFEVFFRTMPPFWKDQGGSLSTLNSKFNNIIAQIKSNGKQTATTAGQGAKFTDAVDKYFEIRNQHRTSGG